ncbi:protein of unknown function DUF239 [Cynara cardunculus var. scolymus]|uniref:Neprosin PEP catalytic domain-containing protein n=1 Tax=Cynara cardunculus var. scolymus TaxID=59895 RepID=A0A103YBY8_CYNCS|nr:protein of unknown function DUF239 [Cynara cardunculus var. scolymus]
MPPSSSFSTSKSPSTKTSIIFTFVSILLLFVPSVVSLPKNETAFRPMQELKKLKRIRTHLKKINKPSIKTIQAFFLFTFIHFLSPDGDLIDCVLSHLQPAFDHPKLKGQKLLEPPLERPNGHNSSDETIETFQLWAQSNEFCPEGTIPIRRTTEKDVLRASSLQRFGRKIRGRVRHDTTSGGHEHAVAFVNGDQYYGAKASINVWTPMVTDPYEFSLSQLWVISGSFGNDLNTVEAGWQVSPELYGDGYPRFFTYWTTDAYQATGCYNLLCSGFVQTNNRIAIGAAVSPRSSYKGKQFDIGIMIWKMGSGHFADEGFGKASYFRNLKVVDWDNSLLPLTNLHLLADHPNCYDIKAGKNNVWGNYIYYGGPGKNGRCQ